MKKLKKILFIIFTFALIIAGASYIDYYFASSNNTYPRLAYKKKVDTDLIVYNALFYRMWYCKSNGEFIIGDYGEEDAACKIVYEYKDGYYTNGSGLKIKEEDLELISLVYSSEQIENMNSETTLENAIYVSSEYAKLEFKYVKDEETNENKKIDKYYLIELPEFKKNKKGKYTFVYNGNNLACYDKTNNKYAEYDSDTCGEFKTLVYDEKWCSLYTNSNLAFDEEIESICKGEEQ